MKKVMFYLLIILFLGTIVIGIQWYLGKTKEEPITSTSSKIISEGKSSQSKKVPEATPNLNISSNSSESEILNAMHSMTHQKIIANEKWKSIPMTSDHITTIKKILESSNFPEKKVLLKIINRWETKDFSRIDKDHNVVWKLQGGTIGKAQGIMTTEEERWFIIHNFGKEAEKEWLENQ